MSALRDQVVEEVRARFAEDRARIIERHRRGQPGGVVVRAYGRLVDATVRKLAPAFFGEKDLALVAVGGYGRGELAFASDVDLHLLHRGPMDEQSARRFLQALWDLGWEVGHQVVTVEQALGLSGGNPQTQTAYLEMRHVWGDRGLPDTLDALLRERLKGERLTRYLDMKVAELEHRHLQAGDTVYLSEPDVKESPGGLRDIHALLWLSNSSGGPRTWRTYLAEEHGDADQYARYRAAYDMLLTVRNGLHLMKGRAWDRLDHRCQVGLAEDLGYAGSRGRLPVEVFMRHYYRAAWEIYAFTAVQLARLGWRPDVHAPVILPVLRTGSGEQESWFHDELDQDPVGIIRGFQRLARSQAALDADTVAWLNRQGRRIGRAARQDPAHGPAFMELLEEPGVSRSLHVMHQLGVLGGLLPEFDRLTALVQFDPYHYYTVDEHTLRALDELERLLDQERQGGSYSGREAEDEALPAGRWESTPRDLALLRLSILFHDIGKGTGGSGHAERGARTLRRAGRRLGLEGADLDDTVFLVRHHLALNQAAQRRDIRDEALLRHLRRLVRDVRRLHLLALMTMADMAALNPGTPGSWRRRLLVDLVDRLEVGLRDRAPRPTTGPLEMAIEKLDDPTRSEVRSFLHSMPPRYRQLVGVDRLVRDRAIHQQFGKADREGVRVYSEAEHGGELSEVTVVTDDRPGLLSRICGLFAANDLTILRALIFTRTDAVAFDRFTVAGVEGGEGTIEDRVERVLKDLPRVLSGQLDVVELLESHRSRWRLRDHPIMSHTASLRFDPAASEQYTVVEVRTQDHVGLLHDVTGAMADMGVAIHQAFVTTEGERAVDAFYVSDPLGAPLDAATKNVLEERVIQALSD
ncbi:[protein-PII] uridylyltransferase [Gemmatimonadota bacterium]